MAGNYPDAPSNRMSLQSDGTQGYFKGIQIDSTKMNNLNDESSSSAADWGSFDSGSFALLFPEKRDIFGSWVHLTWGGTTNAPGQSFYYSTNTTNGVDGTWVNYTQNYSVNAPTAYRSTIQSVSLLGVQGLRFDGGSGSGGLSVLGWHLYGRYSTGQNPNRLEIWDPTLSQRVGGAYFDWGDTPRNSTDTKTFRVKNNSSTLTANSITLSFSSLTDTTPSVAGQHLLSADGTTFTASINIGNLAPGAVSPVLSVRRVTPTNAVVSLWTTRLSAVASSWT